MMICNLFSGVIHDYLKKWLLFPTAELIDLCCNSTEANPDVTKLVTDRQAKFAL